MTIQQYADRIIEMCQDGASQSDIIDMLKEWDNRDINIREARKTQPIETFQNVYCVCGWTGHEFDLIDKPMDHLNRVYCPKCRGEEVKFI